MTRAARFALSLPATAPARPPRPRRLLARLGALALVACAALSHAQPAEPPERRWEERLEALTPADPAGYFLLAEEVADVPPEDAASRALARTLFALAYELDRRAVRDGAPDAGALAPSACVALASLADDPAQARALRALAASLAPSHALAADAALAPAGVAQDEAAFALATALGLHRSGDHARAAAILQRPEVSALLEEFGRMIGGADALLRDVRARPACRECRGARVVRLDPDDAGAAPEGAPRVRLCSTCGGNPGPALDQREMLAHLRLESLLLAGSQRAWSAQLLVDGGEPLRELDPGGLAASVGVDASRPFWRGGAWADNPDAEPAPERR